MQRYKVCLGHIQRTSDHYVAWLILLKIHTNNGLNNFWMLWCHWNPTLLIFVKMSRYPLSLWYGFFCRNVKITYWFIVSLHITLVIFNLLLEGSIPFLRDIKRVCSWECWMRGSFFFRRFAWEAGGTNYDRVLICSLHLWDIDVVYFCSQK